MRARPRVEAAAPRPASATEPVRPAAHSAVRSAQPGDALLELQRGQGNRHVQQVVQNRLLVGPAEDRHERDADRVARQATASGAGPAASVERADRSPTVQRMPAGAGPAGASAPASAGRSGVTPAGRSAVTPAGPEGGVAPPAVAAAVQRGRAEGGRPVPPGVRDRTAAVTGGSFDHVRIHTGPRTDRLTEALGSRAFTVGADVFVRRSEYRPGSARGDQLLAHELAHTAQQGPPVVRRWHEPDHNLPDPKMPPNKQTKIAWKNNHQPPLGEFRFVDGKGKAWVAANGWTPFVEDLRGVTDAPAEEERDLPPTTPAAAERTRVNRGSDDPAAAPSRSPEEVPATEPVAAASIPADQWVSARKTAKRWKWEKKRGDPGEGYRPATPDEVAQLVGYKAEKNGPAFVALPPERPPSEPIYRRKGLSIDPKSKERRRTRADLRALDRIATVLTTGRGAPVTPHVAVLLLGEELLAASNTGVRSISEEASASAEEALREHSTVRGKSGGPKLKAIVSGDYQAEHSEYAESLNAIGKALANVNWINLDAPEDRGSEHAEMILLRELERRMTKVPRRPDPGLATVLLGGRKLACPLCALAINEFNRVIGRPAGYRVVFSGKHGVPFSHWRIPKWMESTTARNQLDRYLAKLNKTVKGTEKWAVVDGLVTGPWTDSDNAPAMDPVSSGSEWEEIPRRAAGKKG